MTPDDLSPDIVLRGYMMGIFPMADPDEDDEIYWYAPDERGILPLDAFHIPRKLRRLLRRRPFEVTRDRAFGDVMRACAEPRADDPQTWISPRIIEVYEALHRYGFAHSVECWRDGNLVGGIYGVHIGGAFFGESMFHRETNASKVALCHLVQHLRARGFRLMDVQFQTDHLAQFGVIEIPRESYEKRLAQALSIDAEW